MTRARTVSDPRPILHIVPPKDFGRLASVYVIDFPPETDLTLAELPESGHVEKGFQFTVVGCRLSLEIS